MEEQWRCQRCALARTWGLTYSRYADDLTFSATTAAIRPRLPVFTSLVREMARQEGFPVNDHKTRVMPRSRRQVVTGVVVNARPNLARDAFDRLKATLHNCRTKGPATQTSLPLPQFRAQLQGQVAWAAQLNPQRGATLRALFGAINWEGGGA